MTPAGPTAVARTRHVFAEGAAARTAELPELRDARSLFLVTGGASFARSGAADALRPALARRRLTRFEGVLPNPTADQVRDAVEALRSRPCDCVLGVGGGSALDVAKAAAALAPQPGDPLDYLLDGRTPERGRACTLVLVPTTSGSGSEATRFAAYYAGGRKRSLDHPSLRCDVAIVDPLLSASQPPEVAGSAGLDALSQAVESYWSPRSTARSRTLARRALRLLPPHLAAACAGSGPARRAVSLAAHLAGRAIDVTRTTAAHALAYPLTAHFGVRHGHACALNLSWLIPYNLGVGPGDVADPRGWAFVRSRLDELLALLGAASGEAAAARVRRLLEQLGLSSRLDRLGVGAADVPRLVAEGLASERAANNPRRLTPEDAARGLVSLLS